MQQSLDIELGPEEALERVVASFEADRGWTIERDGLRLLIYPGDPTDYQLDPRPDSALYRHFPYPETLAVAVEVEAHETGGARVEAKLIRRRVGALMREVGFQMLHPIALANGGALVHGFLRVRWAAARRGGMRRMLRLAIEPLLRYERRAEGGPFRT